MGIQWEPIFTDRLLKREGPYSPSPSILIVPAILSIERQSADPVVKPVVVDREMA